MKKSLLIGILAVLPCLAHGSVTTDASAALRAAIGTYATTPTTSNYAALQAAQTAFNNAVAGNATTTYNAGTVVSTRTDITSANPQILYANTTPVSPVTFQVPGTQSGPGGDFFMGAYAGGELSVGTVNASLADKGSQSAVVFAGNSTSGDGGALRVEYSTGPATLTGAAFTNNSSTGGNGGAISVWGGTVALTDFSFENNSATDGAYPKGMGGAISNYVGGVTLANGRFSGNEARYGGAIAIMEVGGATATNVVFSANTANTGGAIYNWGYLTLTDVSFIGNSASQGGAIYSYNSTIRLNVSAGGRSEFRDNVGGSMYLSDEHTILINVGAGGVLDQRDAMSGYNGSPSWGYISKTGSGLWKLGGATFGGNGMAISVEAGDLYLYDGANIALQNMASSFYFTGDELVAGGTNSITTDSTIVFNEGSILRGGTAADGEGAGGITSSLTMSGGDGRVVMAGEFTLSAVQADDTFSVNANISDGFPAAKMKKAGAGTVNLMAASTYTGGTVVSEGTLVIKNIQAVGGAAGAVNVQGGVFRVEANGTLANTVKLSGGEYERMLSGGADLADSVNATSDFFGGLPNTTAQILEGTLSSASTLSTSFSNVSTAVNDNLRLSDVYSFDGTGSDVFVLQLTISNVSTQNYLGWLDGGVWVNAVAGNTGFNTSRFILGAYDGNMVLGHYGVDVATGSVWAVLNHNSDFAVVPEPSTWILMVLGGGGLFLLARRRQALARGGLADLTIARVVGQWWSRMFFVRRLGCLADREASACQLLKTTDVEESYSSLCRSRSVFRALCRGVGRFWQFRGAGFGDVGDRGFRWNRGFQEPVR